jgi:superfamily I DNA and/or RNA helicase
VFWFDVAGQERLQGTSWWNEKELRAVCQALKLLEREARSAGVHYSVGVIAAYAAQVDRLHHAVRGELGQTKALTLRVDTVDAFQGREVDVVLYSLVRTSGRENPFLGDARRLNVAFSRAKRLLILIGHHSRMQSMIALRPIVERIPMENVLRQGDFQ